MTTFLQLHMLTSYPPSNLNRDDLGRPKTAVMGGSTRLRISSQSLKRAWRKSEVFAFHVAPSNVGTRTKEKGKEIFRDLCASGIEEAQAKEWARTIAGKFGKLKSKSSKKDPHEDLDIEQLAHFTPFELESIAELVKKLAATRQAPSGEDLNLLRKEHTAVDVALFGRMLAANPAFNTEAAAQVAHAITVHAAAVEDDFFTAVDDLNMGDEDRGSAHMGETEFGAGVFYVYMCVDCESLVKNLSGHSDLAGNGIAGLVEAGAKVSPTGKQNSFASRAYASYILAERGIQQPRSLAVSFLKPVTGDDFLEKAIQRLEQTRNRIDTAYGQCWDDCAIMNAHEGAGSLAEILQFARGCVS
ncbi:type I-E CRISPR-associated protein Cas7/Cse4/CasC [Desulfomonile tiedjei]|uniref:CRISPR-associated protein, Cse4 family n=1 Tax=Desulfomonile tiedjei (strain ATCC 49306 / DSM 6799 / DCB-1) TaxID=706587 RepID=I4CC93_DESTA|nr:type I-E CRISPR-associated protein Cas7/Cse4/CasC [Desulfomonile tiedjei]AFM27184.1 CRISPR-associated protein, Cse4 family [Desulfomonile tiedjei DSM 6799]